MPAAVTRALVDGDDLDRSPGASTPPETAPRRIDLAAHAQSIGLRSIEVGMPLQWERTKNGVVLASSTPSLKTANGVSSCGGRLVSRISGRFCGKTTSSRSPLSKGSTTRAAVAASACSAGCDAAAAVPIAPSAFQSRGDALSRSVWIVVSPMRVSSARQGDIGFDAL